MNLSQKMVLTPAPSRQQQRTERTRARLLEAAREVFLEHGYDAASIGELTKRADLGAGTYYLHFRDKRSLYEGLVRRELSVLRTRWLEQRAARKVNGEPWLEISLMVEMVLESVLEDLAFASLILLDGPPLETFLVEDIGREMARVLGDRVSSPELVANLVIGATLNTGRWALMRPRAVPTRRLVTSAVDFCAAGVGAMNTQTKKKRRG
jgi:AcrR family transcriptional regulator